MRFDSSENTAFYYVDSDEGRWNSGREPGTNLGYRPRYKEGYFPVPPPIIFRICARDMVLKLQEVGIEVECHHHEVATAGQCEIDFKFDTLIRAADNMMKYKYIVRKRGVQVRQNGHLHAQADFLATTARACTPTSHCGTKANRSSPATVMRDCQPDGDVVYRRAAEACARDGRFAAPSTNSYKRLVPGFRSAGEPGILAPQSFGCRAHTDVFDQSEGKAA